MISYDGCGEYKGDYRLNDIWVLKNIKGDNIQTDTKAPNLEFQLAESKVYGLGGCNRMNGEIEFSDETVSFGPLNNQTSLPRNGA